MNRAVGLSRDDVTKRVMIAIATGSEVVELPYRAPDGTQPLVVTTPNEYLSEVVLRVEAAGGSANIALAEATKFTIFVIERSSTPRSLTPSEDLMNEDLSMGMFWLKATRKPSASGRFRLRNSEATIPVDGRKFAYA